MTLPTDEKLDEMARDLCHTGELSMPYRCEISDAIMSIRAQIASPAPVTLADALQVPEVQVLVEALRTLLIAADGESYAEYFGAIETATAALRAIGEGEA